MMRQTMRLWVGICLLLLPHLAICGNVSVMGERGDEAQSNSKKSLSEKFVHNLSIRKVNSRRALHIDDIAAVRPETLGDGTPQLQRAVLLSRRMKKQRAMQRRKGRYFRRQRGNTKSRASNGIRRGRNGRTSGWRGGGRRDRNRGWKSGWWNGSGRLRNNGKSDKMKSTWKAPRNRGWGSPWGGGMKKPGYFPTKPDKKSPYPTNDVPPAPKPTAKPTFPPIEDLDVRLVQITMNGVLTATNLEVPDEDSQDIETLAIAFERSIRVFLGEEYDVNVYEVGGIPVGSDEIQNIDEEEDVDDDGDGEGDGDGEKTDKTTSNSSRKKKKKWKGPPRNLQTGYGYDQSWVEWDTSFWDKNEEISWEPGLAECPVEDGLVPVLFEVKVVRQCVNCDEETAFALGAETFRETFALLDELVHSGDLSRAFCMNGLRAGVVSYPCDVRITCVMGLFFYDRFVDEIVETSAPTPSISDTEPTNDPTALPTSGIPTFQPTDSVPTSEPTPMETTITPSTIEPTSSEPTSIEPTTIEPTATSDTPTIPLIPTYEPTPLVTTMAPTTDEPTYEPTPLATTETPTFQPTDLIPTPFPTVLGDPTLEPTILDGDPTLEPTIFEGEPTLEPTEFITRDPTLEPTIFEGEPTLEPTELITRDPTLEPTFFDEEPTLEPTELNTREPTRIPTALDSQDPTFAPTLTESTPLFIFGSSESVGNSESFDYEVPFNLEEDVIYASAGSEYTLVILDDESAAVAGFIDNILDYTGYFGVPLDDLDEGSNELLTIESVVNLDGDLRSAPNFRRVYAGVRSGDALHSVLIDVDGNVYATGSNGSGQLCLGDLDDRNIPHQIDLGEDAVSAAVGGEFTLILGVSGDVYGCGDNGSGQLGLGNIDFVEEPDSRNGLTNVRSISAGLDFSLLSTDDGLAVMGSNSEQQLCTNEFDFVDEPFFLDAVGEDDTRQFRAGLQSSYILFSDGSVAACGLNVDGQLGIGVFDDPGPETVVIPGNNFIKTLGVGPSASSAFFVALDGVIYGTGLNDRGQLGLGDRDDRDSPEQVLFEADADDVTRISAGTDHTLAW